VLTVETAAFKGRQI